MAVRSGVAAQLGLAAETTYGTFVAPATFYPFESESLSLEKEYIRSAGLRAGQLAQSGLLHVATTKTGEGSIEFPFLTKGMGKLLNLLSGGTVTPVQIGATAAYTQTHPVGLTDPFGKSVAIQVGRPDVGGTVRSFSYLGCKLTGVTFSLERGGVVTAEWSFDCRDEDTGQTLGTATYAAGAIPISFQAGSIEFDDVALTDCIHSWTVEIGIPQETERYCISSSAVKKEPIQNGLVSIEMTLEAEFASLTQHAAFAAATRRKVELLNGSTATTGDAGGGNAYQLNFTAPQTVTTGAGPVVSGPDVLTQELTLECVANGTDAPLTAVYISTDTAL